MSPLPSPEAAPPNAVAADLAAAAVGRQPTAVRRFGAGLHHHVFEASFADRAPVVVRIAAEHSRAAMAGALALSRLLRPRGVPLPEIIAEGVDHAFSHLVLERLPGVDLGEVIRALSDASLETIANDVAAAQRITSQAAPGVRYGYGVEAASAPRGAWSEVLLDNLARSRGRIAAAKLFSEDAVDAVDALVSQARAVLNAQPPIAFLHDTTTKNVIVTPDGSFSGIVDVDDLCFARSALRRRPHAGFAVDVRRPDAVRRRLDARRRPSGRRAIPALCRPVPRRFHVRAWAGFQWQRAVVIARGAGLIAERFRGAVAAHSPNRDLLA